MKLTTLLFSVLFVGASNAQLKLEKEMPFQKKASFSNYIFEVGGKILEVENPVYGNQTKISILNADFTTIESKKVSDLIETRANYTSEFRSLSNGEVLVSCLYNNPSYVNTNVEPFIMYSDEKLNFSKVSISKWKKDIGQGHAAFHTKNEFFFIFYPFGMDNKEDNIDRFTVIKATDSKKVEKYDLKLSGHSKEDDWSFAGSSEDGFYFSSVELKNDAKQLVITLLKFSFEGELIDEKSLELENSTSIYGPNFLKAKHLNLEEDFAFVKQEYKGNVLVNSYKAHSFAYIYFDKDFNDFVLTTNSIGICEDYKKFKNNENEKGLKLTVFNEELEEKFHYEFMPFVTTDMNLSKNQFLTPKYYNLDRRSEKEFIVKSDGWLHEDGGKFDLYYFMDENKQEVFAHDGYNMLYKKGNQVSRKQIDKKSYKKLYIETYVPGVLFMTYKSPSGEKISPFKKIW